MPTELIIDTDAGIDDAQAILLALGSPDAQVAAITTLSGNVHVDKVTRNVLLALNAAGKHVPVYRGAERPLVIPLVTASDFHGEDGLGDTNFPPVPGQVEHEHAVLALTRMAAEHPGRYTLVAIGPLTNIALATRLDPSFPHNLANFIFMGGAHSARGNTNVVAEFNIATDPEAAAIVLDTFPKSTMVSWELSLDYAIHLDQLERLNVHSTPALDFFKKISLFLIKKYRESGDPLPVPDPLAVAIAIAPDLAQESAIADVAVELHGMLTRGQTVTNWRGVPGMQRVNIILKIDAERFWQMMLTSLGVG